MAYDKNIDYQQKINEAIDKGDYASAASYEQSRNEKIDGEGLSVSKTNNFTGLTGVPNDLLSQSLKPRAESEEEKTAQKKAEGHLSNLESIAGKENIISDDVKTGLGQQFSKPSAVIEADAYLSEQLKKIQSGKTSYSDQVREMMDKIMNREKFSYDVDKDPLFQQALASAMNSGKQAMQDTIGQASALTGGYGSTYATSAGNQAYNSFIEDAYNNLPQYYQMAMEAYQMEGDEMYRQFGMVSELDDKEYNRNVAAYDATYQHRNQLYNEAYSQFRDSKSDAFAMADLQLTEHGQKVSDAYNLYSASSDYYENLYAKSYNEWAANIANNQWLVNTLSNEAWKTKEFDYQKEWNNTQFDYTKERDTVKDSQWQKEYELDEKLTNAQIANMGRSGSGGGGGGKQPQNTYTQFELSQAGQSQNVSRFFANVLTPSEFSSRGGSRIVNGKSVRYDSYESYIEDKIDEGLKTNELTDVEASYLVGYYFMK